MADGDAELGQMIGRADAGELQELRAVEAPPQRMTSRSARAVSAWPARR
jgi:hypothetical protein